jgi:hypothetical protein
MCSAVRPPTAIDERYRSLLQKAVRRGHVDLVLTVGACIEAASDPEWFERRTGLIVLSECWPLGGRIAFTKAAHSKLAALAQAARARKDRDAAGLGLLAYALARGDRSVLTGAEDERAVRLLAQAVQRPAKFWEWVASQPCGEVRRHAITRAERLGAGDRPHDHSVIQAAAYLASSAPLPQTPEAAPAPGPFPYWAVLDRHTAAGKRALRDVARDLHLKIEQLEWCYYYYEGATANADAPSPWWARYCRWGFERHGLHPDEAPLLWEPARAQLAEALSAEGHALQAEVYSWSLAHRDRIDLLKQQVELFLERLREVPRDQRELF